MSEYSREILLATSVLCASRGAMTPPQLYRKMLERCSITKKEFDYIMRECPRFLLVQDQSGGGGGRPEDCTVLARTSLRLCGGYGREECGSARNCQQLHLCKFFIYGNCRFDSVR